MTTGDIPIWAVGGSGGAGGGYYGGVGASGRSGGSYSGGGGSFVVIDKYVAPVVKTRTVTRYITRRKPAVKECPYCGRSVDSKYHEGTCGICGAQK